MLDKECIVSYSDLTKKDKYMLDALSKKHLCGGKEIMLKALHTLYNSELKWDVDLDSTLVYYFTTTKMSLGKLKSVDDNSVAILTKNNKVVRRVKDNVFFNKEDALKELERLKEEDEEKRMRNHFRLF